MKPNTFYKGYSDGPFGQTHWRMALPEVQTEPDLYCLHPAPFSGLAYQNLMPKLATARRVIAPDYPGFGGSDPHILTPSIDDYAEAMIEMIDTHSGKAKFDLVGFHTGCLVAAEIARRLPDRARKTCLIDVPAFPSEISAELVKSNGQPPELSEDISCLASAWKMGVTARHGIRPLDEALGMFAEQVRIGSFMNAAFHAAFSYPWAERFADITSDVMVLATKSSLLEGSLVTAKTITGARLVERFDITRSVLDENAAFIAGEIETYFGDA